MIRIRLRNILEPGELMNHGPTESAQSGAEVTSDKTEQEFDPLQIWPPVVLLAVMIVAGVIPSVVR